MTERDDDILEVGIGQLAVASAPTRLVSYSLGSCVALVCYDPVARVGGIAHVMLPASNPSSCTGRAKFADLAVEALIEAMEELGADRRCIATKLVGGASLFESRDGDPPSVGERNVAALKEQLRRAQIPVIAEDTGGDFARTVILTTEDGRLKVRSLARGDREL